MYEDMARAGFDVRVLETVGTQEKCVDIQLAVDMLHFTGPTRDEKDDDEEEEGDDANRKGKGKHDYYLADRAVVLTGDLDFRPAIERIREKGGGVTLASIRTSCSKELGREVLLRVLPEAGNGDEGKRGGGDRDSAAAAAPTTEAPDIIWIEDHLDSLIEKKHDGDKNDDDKSDDDKSDDTRPGCALSSVDGNEVDGDLLDLAVASAVAETAEPGGAVGEKVVASPRQMGRYLKKITVPDATRLKGGKGGGRPLLTVLKERSGSLMYHLMSNPNLFEIVQPKDGEKEKFYVALKMSLSTAKEEMFSQATIDLFESMREGLAPLSAVDSDDVAPRRQVASASSPPLVSNAGLIKVPPPPQPTVSSLLLKKQPELKDMCIEMGLPVSGTKTVLAERICKALSDRAPPAPPPRLNALPPTAAAAQPPPPPPPSPPQQQQQQQQQQQSLAQGSVSSSTQRPVLPAVDPKALAYLKAVVREYVRANSPCGSRDVGRFLSNRKDSKGLKCGEANALCELKDKFGNVVGFMKRFMNDEIDVVQNKQKSNEAEFYENKQNANNIGDFFTVFSRKQMLPPPQSRY